MQECPAEQCKDSNGEWTKWVPERMDDTQRVVYDRYMLMVSEHPELRNVTTNNHLRFLNGCKWDAQKSIEFMMASEKYRVEK